MTRDAAQAAKDIEASGFCIIPDVLPADRLGRVREALYRAASEDRARGWEQKFRLDYAHDETNQRVWNLLSRDPVFADLVEDPLALGLVKSTLGWPALLGNISANITGPGGGEMVLHADQIFVPEPWPAKPQGVNVAWCVDDFTDENGATRIVPGSHLLNRKPAPDEAAKDSVAARGAGRLDHRHGEPRLAQDGPQPHARAAARRHLRLVHAADLSPAGELVPVAQSRHPAVCVGRPAGAAGLPDGGAGPGQRQVACLMRRGGMDLEAKKRQLLDEGCCVVPGVLTAAETERVRERLWAAAKKSERLGVPTRQIGLDPNEHNVRVFYLLERDAIFRELIQHPTAIEFVTTLLGPDFLISNFTANIALPGSKSMELHSDQGIVVPEPWFHPWSINVIWCLNDVDEENGATRYVPGSHRLRWASELPPDAREKTVPFKASAGSSSSWTAGYGTHRAPTSRSRANGRCCSATTRARSSASSRTGMPACRPRRSRRCRRSCGPGSAWRRAPTSSWRSGCASIRWRRIRS